MCNTARLLRFLIPALGLLAAACSDHAATLSSSPYAGANGVTATAPNPNNPYATDPLDPDMNPRYMRHPHGGPR